MFINWEDSTLRFDPVSPDPFATHGIPLPVYGNYGGPNWSAGQVGGVITQTSADPLPADDLDELFYAHDFVYQTHPNPGDPTDLAARTAADIVLVESIHDLTFTDPEASLYGGFATLGILLQLSAGGVVVPDQNAIVQEAIDNVEVGLAAVPGEAKSLHGAFHVFEHQFLDFLHV
jgi:hypothetical protein